MNEHKDLHEELLGFLLKKHEENNSFLFRPYVKTKQAEPAFTLGEQWFGETLKNGNTALVFSFWKGHHLGLGIDTKTNDLYLFVDIPKPEEAQKNRLLWCGFPNILWEGWDTAYSSFENLNRRRENPVMLEHITGASYEEIKFAMPDFAKEVHSYFVLIKNYGPWKEGLERFIKTDKPKIDAFVENLLQSSNDGISHEQASFGFISQEEFALEIRIIEEIKFLKKAREYSGKQGDAPLPNPYRLGHITLKNISFFKNTSLDLSRKVTLIIGENGSGKSSVLKALGIALSGVFFWDLDKDLAKRKNLFLGKMLKISAYNHGKPIYEKKGEINFGLNFNNGSKEYSSISFQPSELDSAKVEAEEGDARLRTLILEERRFFAFPIIAFSQTYVADNDEPQQTLRPGVQDLLPLLEDTPQNTLGNITEWVYYYVHEAQNRRPVEMLFRTISLVVSEGKNEKAVYLKEKIEKEGVVGSPSGQKTLIVCTPDSPQGIDFLMVSLGYKNLFRWIGGILMKLQAFADAKQEKDLLSFKGVVLIDEIDTYLHPTWQRHILQILNDTFPNLQFVVTSHSPAVLSSLKDKNGYYIYKAAKYRGESFFTEFDPGENNPYGATLNDVAENVMGYAARDPEIQQQLDELLSAISDKNIELADMIINRLKASIAPEDRGLQLLKSRLDTQKFILKSLNR